MTEDHPVLFEEERYAYVRAAVDRVKLAWEQHQLLGSGKPMSLAFSGGKDSVCVYGVCKIASEELDVPFDTMFYMQYNITNVDPPELVRFVREKYPQAHLHHPEKTMWKLIVDKHMPPIRKARYCCAELKEVSKIEGGFTLTGVRHAESSRRANRGAIEVLGKSVKDRILLNDNDDDRRWIENCMQKRAFICNPIIDWSDEDVWNFIKKEKLPYCSLYDEGWARLGCIGCPLASEREREKEFKRWPNYEKQYVRTFQKMLDKNKERDSWKDRESFSFIDGQDVFDWWMHRPVFKERHQKELEAEDNLLFKFEEDV